VVHTTILDILQVNEEECSLSPAWEKLVADSISKKQNTERNWVMAQVLECLPCIHEALGSISGTTKKIANKYLDGFYDFN
jgi:hypothetical protein